jgi:hypothetical protein
MGAIVGGLHQKHGHHPAALKPFLTLQRAADQKPCEQSMYDQGEQ